MSLLDLGRILRRVPFHVEAPCLDGGGDWHAESAGLRALAAARCSGCPILDPCLSGALDRDEVVGVWGGVDLETALKQSPRDEVRSDLRALLDARGGSLTH